MDSFDLNRLCLGCMNYLDDPDAPCPVCGRRREEPNEGHQLVPGSILNGKYVVGRSLGQGGFGITYIAWDIPNAGKVAIKEYYPSDSVTRQSDLYTVMPYSTQGVAKLFAEGREKFFSEAQSLARFDSVPGIVSVRDFFQENDTAYIVMEFIEGQTLAQYLTSLGRPMQLEDVLALLAPVADSLEQVHAAGLIHRDISPDNIMITDNGSAKLLDFGASRAFSLNGERSNTVNVRMGYAPEEQYLTHGEQGPWTDVYALAATIYKAITGVTPVQAIDRARSDTLERPSALGIAITPAQESVLLRGMAVFHKNRYHSVREFFNAITAAGHTTGGGGSSGGARFIWPELYSGEIKPRVKLWAAIGLIFGALLWIIGVSVFNDWFLPTAFYSTALTFLVGIPGLISLCCAGVFAQELFRRVKGLPYKVREDYLPTALIIFCVTTGLALLVTLISEDEDLFQGFMLYSLLALPGVLWGYKLLDPRR